METIEAASEEPKLSVIQQSLKSSNQLRSLQQQQHNCSAFIFGTCNCSKIVESKKDNKFKMMLFGQIIRATIYMLVALGIFNAFERNRSISLHEQTYFSSEQVVYPSQIRGLFPPIKGYPNQLYGRWKILFTNSLQIPNKNTIYSNYTIELKQNRNLRIKRRGCEGDLTMIWQVYQHNIYIRQYNIDANTDKQMIIEPDENDVNCIKEQSLFLDHLLDTSVWTLSEDRLYLLVEKWKDGRNIQSIIVLGKIG